MWYGLRSERLKSNFDDLLFGVPTFAVASNTIYMSYGMIPVGLVVIYLKETVHEGLLYKRLTAAEKWIL